MKFNNKLESDMRVEQEGKLFSMIFDIEKNNGKYYRNEIYEKAKKRLRERET